MMSTKSVVGTCSWKTYLDTELKDFPCQAGADMAYKDGKMCDEPVFRALCAHTCSAVLPVEVAGKGYFYQDVNIFPTDTADWSRKTVPNQLLINANVLPVHSMLVP